MASSTLYDFDTITAIYTRFIVPCEFLSKSMSVKSATSRYAREELEAGFDSRSLYPSS